MKTKKKKIILSLVIGVLAVALIAGGLLFYVTQLQWLALDDIAVEVVWNEEDEAFHTFFGFTVVFHTRETAAYLGNERIDLRDGIRIRNDRPYIRARDIIALNRTLNAILETGTAAPVGVMVNGLYNQGTDEQNAMIQSLLGNESARNRFEVYFQWHNTIHELGHMITVHHGTYDPNNMKNTRHMVDEELLVNSFAIAFWLHYGEEEKINALEEMVDYALSNLTPPAENVSPRDYMREAIDKGRFEEILTFEVYGWFQFSLVQEILQERESLDLAALLAEMTGMENIQLPPINQPLEYPALGVDTVPQIVADVTSLLREAGISVPNVYIAFSTDPNQHMMLYPTSHALLESDIATGRLIPAYH